MADAKAATAKVISYRNQVWGKIELLERLAQIAWGGFVVHYFLWPILMASALYLLYAFGYGWLSALVFALYLPSFFNNDQLKLGRPWHWFRTSRVWRLPQRYLEMEMTREAPLDPCKRYIFGIYPHGILVLSRLAMYAGAFEDLFPGIETRVLGASPMFWIPGSRELCLWMGAVDASRRTASNVLRKGLSLMVYPGGSKEIFLTDPLSKDTVLIARTGFIRLALQEGASLLPTFVFGEKWAYKKLELPRIIRDFFLNTLRVPLIIFWGRFFTWLPLQREKRMAVVFGAPIDLPQIAEPSQEEVDEYHRKYMAQVERIFSQYKEQYGYDKEERIVWKQAAGQD